MMRGQSELRIIQKSGEKDNFSRYAKIQEKMPAKM